MKRVTLKDIAEKADVSVATVSLALRNDERITKTVRDRVQKLATSLGYKVDLLGAILRANNPMLIGVVAELSQELHREYTREIVCSAQEYGYHVIVEDASIRGSMQEAYHALSSLHVQNVIAVNPPMYSKDHALIPSVAIGQRSPSPSTDLFTSDNYDGMRQLVTHLRECGCNKIFYLDGPKGISSEARLKAFVVEAEKSDIDFAIRVAGNDMHSGYQAVSEMLANCSSDFFLRVKNGDPRLADKKNAIVCYNDQCAQGAIMALYREGIRVPEEVLVAGFDNSALANTETFSLTSVDRNVKEIANLALKQAILRHQTGQKETVTVHVPTKLVIRKSTTVNIHSKQ